MDPVSKACAILYSTYLPTSGQDDNFLDILAQLNFNLSQNIDDDLAVIIGTDTNVSNQSTKRRYNAMQTFLDFHSLNTILTNQEPTFHHNNQSSESQIDHIYFSIPKNSKISVSFKNQLCLKENSSNLSSHDVLIGEIVLPATSEEASKEDFSSTYTPFVVKKPNWDETGKAFYQKKTASILQKLSNEYTGREFIPLLCEMFSRALVICAENNFDVKNPLTKHKNKKHKTFPYFSKEYKDAHAAHKSVFSDWRKAGRPSDNSHPAKEKVLQSRRHLQSIARDEESSKSIKLLMT